MSLCQSKSPNFELSNKSLRPKPVYPVDCKCPVCTTKLGLEGDNVVELSICPRCSTPHHTDCWEYAGGCAIYGCRESACQKDALTLAAADEGSNICVNRIMDWYYLFCFQWICLFLIVGLASMGLQSIYLSEMSRDLLSEDTQVFLCLLSCLAVTLYVCAIVPRVSAWQHVKKMLANPSPPRLDLEQLEISHWVRKRHWAQYIEKLLSLCLGVHIAFFGVLLFQLNVGSLPVWLVCPSLFAIILTLIGMKASNKRASQLQSVQLELRAWLRP